MDSLFVERREREKEPPRLFLWHTTKALCLRFECEQAREPRGVDESVDFMLTRDDIVAVCLDFRGTRKAYLWNASPA